MASLDELLMDLRRRRQRQLQQILGQQGQVGMQTAPLSASSTSRSGLMQQMQQILMNAGGQQVGQQVAKLFAPAATAMSPAAIPALNAAQAIPYVTMAAPAAVGAGAGAAGAATAAGTAAAGTTAAGGGTLGAWLAALLL